MRYFLVVSLLSVAACQCGTSTLATRPECEVHPNDPSCQPPKMNPPPPAPMCGNGKVEGIVCAPDVMTYVADATVSVSGTCDGKNFAVRTTTDSMGHFELTVPEGSWTIQASSGSFSRSYMVTVTANQTTMIPADQFCFKPNTTNLAVISGNGDHIETLLTQIGFTPTVIDGSPTGFDGPNGGLQFLKDPTQLAKYNVLFIDCGAGRTPVPQSSGKTYDELNFGSDAQTIASNLQNFVEKGGSLYASDWAFMFIYLAYQQEFSWQSNASFTFPYDTYNLTGFGPPSVTADVVDMGLAGYLGKSQVTINFPKKNWGLMNMVNNPAQTLISGTVEPCTDSTCRTAGSSMTAPLAALYRVTNGPGGAVAYTSFHNIDQTGQDVQNILKYLIFKL